MPNEPNQNTLPQKRVDVWMKLLADDKAKLKEKATLSHMSLPQYLIHLAENRPIIVVSEFGKFTAELNKIGTNINQIAVVANSQKFVSAENLKLLHDYSRMIESIGKQSKETLDKARKPKTKSENELYEYLDEKFDLVLTALKNEKEKEGEKWLL
jgi:chemotaxis response regulator CheB